MDNSNQNKITLNPDSFTPLYIQVAQLLRDAINSGQFKSGEKLPSENELVKKYGISRITATTALDELVKARLAYRERGRGTFAAKPFVSNFSFFSSFTEDMLERGLKPSSRQISSQIEKPDRVTIEKLKMPVDEEYHCLTRVRLADGEPVVYQHAYLPTAIFPNLGEQDFEKHYLYEIIRNVYGCKPTWAEAIVESGGATQEEADYLDVKPGYPVLIIWHLTLDDRHTPLEYVRSVYRSDRFSFSTGRNPLHTFGS
jgi:GntR family transcriptional regulator